MCNKLYSRIKKYCYNVLFVTCTCTCVLVTSYIFIVLAHFSVIFSRSYSEEWRADKKFVMTAFRKFGLGSNSLEGKIRTEVTQLLDELRDTSVIDLRLPVERVLTRVITSVVYDSEYSLDDPEVDHVIKLCRDFLEKSVTNDILRFALNFPKWMYEILFREAIKIAREKCREIQAFMLVSRSNVHIFFKWRSVIFEISTSLLS